MKKKQKCFLQVSNSTLKVAEHGYDTCVSFTLSSTKTLYPLVTKNGSMQVNDTNFGFFDSLADIHVCATAMAASVTINRPLRALRPIFRSCC